MSKYQFTEDDTIASTRMDILQFNSVAESTDRQLTASSNCQLGKHRSITNLRTGLRTVSVDTSDRAYYSKAKQNLSLYNYVHCFRLFLLLYSQAVILVDWHATDL